MGLGKRILLRAVPVALGAGGLLVAFGYVFSGAVLTDGEAAELARAVSWRLGGLIGGLTFLAMALLELVRWRAERAAAAAGAPPAK